MKKVKDDRSLVFFCDMHGHSRKKNIFMCIIFYLDGNSGRDNLHREMLFPLLMRDNCPVFSF
jgi:hypothetical protein